MNSSHGRITFCQLSRSKHEICHLICYSVASRTNVREPSSSEGSEGNSASNEGAERPFAVKYASILVVWDWIVAASSTMRLVFVEDMRPSKMCAMTYDPTFFECENFWELKQAR